MLRSSTRAIALSCLLLPVMAWAQLNPKPARSLRTSKAEVVSFAVSPKGDMLLVGLNNGAELLDITSGKKVHAFPFNEDGATVVYHVGFNDNGEFAVLIGHSGKRSVWGVKTGKQEKVISEHRWVPDPRAVKAMGLDMKNSTFDRFYQQTEATHGELTFRASKNGVVEVMQDGKVVQKLEVPENKDQHHRAPLLVYNGQLLVGTDDGRVLFYDLP